MESKQIDEAAFCLNWMAYDDQILQSYRMIFIALEAILFGFALAVTELKIDNIFPYVFSFGVAFTILWIIICTHRGKLVNASKKRLQSILSGSELGGYWDR